MDSRADVRVGIVSWNTADLLDRCLSTLRPGVERLRAEVVVVDNGSTDDSVDVARSHPGVVVRTNSANVGYAAAMNEALAGTTARALVALNPDTEIAPGGITSLVRQLDEHPRAGLAVPILLGADGNLQHSLYPFPGIAQALESGLIPMRWRRLQRHPTAGDGDGTQEVRRSWAVGAVHCLRAAAVASGGPYSTRTFMYGEDIDVCWRLRRAGWSIILCTDVSVIHHGNASGVQRWGTGARLEARSLPGIYGWLWDDRSPALGRATGGITAVALALKAAGLRLTAEIVTEDERARRLVRADELRYLRQLHAAVVRGGPRALVAMLEAE